MYTSLDEIQQANATIGQGWFSPFNTKYFGSIYHLHVYGGHYFTTSEKEPNGTRIYSVRYAHEDGTVTTASGYGEFSTWEEARTYAKQLAATQVLRLEAINGND